jgi:hypothetical protein
VFDFSASEVHVDVGHIMMEQSQGTTLHDGVHPKETGIDVLITMTVFVHSVCTHLSYVAKG